MTCVTQRSSPSRHRLSQTSVRKRCASRLDLDSLRDFASVCDGDQRKPCAQLMCHLQTTHVGIWTTANLRPVRRRDVGVMSTIRTVHASPVRFSWSPWNIWSLVRCEGSKTHRQTALRIRYGDFLSPSCGEYESTRQKGHCVAYIPGLHPKGNPKSDSVSVHP